MTKYFLPLKILYFFAKSYIEKKRKGRSRRKRNTKRINSSGCFA